MRLAFWHQLSLRRTLLVILLPTMVVIASGELWLTWRTAVDAANAAYDRSLFGAIKAIDANISTESGGVGVELPYRLLEFFQLTASGSVYFRVATEDGLVEVGYADLPPPKLPLVSGRPQFADAIYFGEHVRVGSYARRLTAPVVGQSGEQRIVIQVAESVTSRSDFTRALLLQAVSRDVILVAVGATLLALLVSWALKPLQRLRSEVISRGPEDLAPIDAADVPRDVVPLVDAINNHVQRNRELVESRRRFVDDASHQLRTPLATLTAQVAYALREPDPTRVRDALHAVKQQLDETVRRTNQMLALARADTAELVLENLDLNDLAEQATREWWGGARDKGIDLGFEADSQPLQLRSHGGLLREAIGNLIDNALRYTPRDGHVTVRVHRDGDWAALTVIDDGPGIPADERERAGERFFRASNVPAAGSGIGLAIARSLARRLGGDLRVDGGPGGVGCAVTIHLPPPVEASANGLGDAAVL